MPSSPVPTKAQQITVTSPAEVRSANVPFGQALARDVETLAQQVNLLTRLVEELRKA